MWVKPPPEKGPYKKLISLVQIKILKEVMMAVLFTLNYEFKVLDEQREQLPPD